ncbi:MAG TPA: hypothetical protein PLF26_02275 [Blastocatellia bacterium]|nr:hypothetical protein [Blastocatellia bacterium]
MSQTVCERETSAGHRLEITWSGAQTALPTGALDQTAKRRTRYFFDVMVDGLYYFGNRFLTSADAEGRVDAHGTPILTRTDLLLKLCADRVAAAIESGQLNSLPNDLGFIELENLDTADAPGAEA